MTEIIPFIITSLATYGMSSLLTSYSGPGNIFLRLRNKYPKSPLCCIVCTATWVALVFFAVQLAGLFIYLTPLAIVGIVIILEGL